METHRLRWIARTARVLLALPAAMSAQFTPAPATGIPATGANPVSVAVGNFNSDLLPDLAIANLNANSITVLLNTTMGTFAAAPGSPITTGVGTNPTSIAVADFNGDGFQDLAIANLTDGTITVLLGTGTGTFMPSAAPATVSPIFMVPHPASIAAGNFNGYMGLAIADEVEDTVTVLLGNGQGVFTPASPLPYVVGNHPVSIAVGNFNGHMGFAVANELDDTVTVYTGDGAGTFMEAQGSPFQVDLPTASVPVAYPVSVAVGDFNGDSIPDLVVANEGTNTISILQGAGDGMFTLVAGGAFPVGLEPVSLAVADFNSDNKPDVAIANYASGNVTVLLGDGNFGFTPALGSPYPAGSLPRSLAVGDFNADGKPDLAVANEGSNDVTVLLNGIYTLMTVSSASGMAPVAPGSIVSIYGTNLAVSGTTASTTPLPITLGGTIVTIAYSDGSQGTLPLFYAGPAQINAEIPMSAPSGPATITASTPAGPQHGPLMLAEVAPGLFSADQDGKGVAIAQLVTNLTNGFQTITDAFQCPGAAVPCIAVPLNVSPANSVGDSVLVLYGTGIQNAGLANVMVQVGDNNLLPATYVGPAGYAGEDQVNVPLPSSLAGMGTLQVSVVAAGIPSNTVTIYIQ